MPFANVELPSVFLTRRVGSVTPEETAAMVQRLRKVLSEASSPCIVVYDAGHDPSGRPDARSRQHFATLFADEDGLLRKRCSGIDCAFPSPLSRGVLTAVLWVKSPPIGTHVHANCRDAVRAAVARAGSKADVDGLVKALDDASAAVRAESKAARTA